MLDLKLIKARLESINKGIIRTVHLGTDQGAISPKSLPAVFILPTQERAGANSRVMGISQQVQIDFGVEIVVSNKRLDNWVEDLQEVRAAIQTQLLNWVPADNFQAIEVSSGALLNADKELARWIDEFRTAEQISIN